MANPFGYGDNLGFSRTQIGNAGLIPTEWLNEGFQFALPGVYFPNVTPSITEMGAGAMQNVVVPLVGEMVDTSWPTLSRGTSITVGSYNMDSITVLLSEAGRGIEAERFLQQLMKPNLYPGEPRRFAQKLTNNLVMSWENELRSIYLNCKFAIKSVAAGSYTTIRDSSAMVSGAASGTARADIFDYVLNNFRTPRIGTFGTFVVPPYEDGLYRAVGNYSTIRGFFTDTQWQNLQTRNQNLAGRGMIVRDLGDFGGFRWIEHPLMPDGTILTHGRNCVAQAWGGLFAEDAITPNSIMTVRDSVIPFQLRWEFDWQNDFHRSKACAWYTVAGSAAAMRDIGTHAIIILVATTA